MSLRGLNELSTMSNGSTPFRSILIARLGPGAIDSAQASIDACNFTAEQQEFIQRWMRKEFNLTLLEVSQEEGNEETRNTR